MRRSLFYIIICFIGMQSMNAQENSKIKITINSSTFVATTYDNATARAFISLLPMTVNVAELNGNEKYFYLNANLPAAQQHPIQINTGDLMLWGTNCIVLFYETFNTSYSYTQIGSIDNPSDLEAALGSGNPTVKFELLTNLTSVENIEQNNTEYHITNGILQFSSNIKKITIIDIKGKIVLNSSTNSIDIKILSAGLYIVNISSTDGVKTIKIAI